MTTHSSLSVLDTRDGMIKILTFNITNEIIELQNIPPSNPEIDFENVHAQLEINNIDADNIDADNIDIPTDFTRHSFFSRINDRGNVILEITPIKFLILNYNLPSEYKEF